MNKTQVQIDENTHIMLMSSKTQIMTHPTKYPWFDDKNLDWDNIINYALQKAFGKDKDATNAINE